MTCSKIQETDCYQKVFEGNQVPIASIITAIFWATVLVSVVFFLPGAPRVPVISSTPFLSCSLIGALVSSVAAYLLSTREKTVSETEEEDFIEFDPATEISFCFEESTLLEDGNHLEEILEPFLKGQPLSEEGIDLYLQVLNEKYPDVAFLNFPDLNLTHGRSVEFHYASSRSHEPNFSLDGHSKFYVLVKRGMFKGMVVFDVDDKTLKIVSVNNCLNDEKAQVSFKALGDYLVHFLGKEYNEKGWAISYASLPAGMMIDSEIVALEYARSELEGGSLVVDGIRTRVAAALQETFSPPTDLDFLSDQPDD